MTASRNRAGVAEDAAGVAALRWAVTRARSQNAELIAVRTWMPPDPAWTPTDPDRSATAPDLRAVPDPEASERRGSHRARRPA